MKSTKDKMKELLDNSANWSTARYLYYVSIFIEAFTFLLTVVVIAALTMHGRSSIVNNSPEFKKAFIYCAFAVLIFASLAFDACGL